MGAGAGHVLDMINRMKQNRAQRPSNRGKFKENNREGIYSTNKNPEQLNFKIVSKKELHKIKLRIRERAKLEVKKERIIYGVFILCAVISLIGIKLWLK